MLLAPIFTLLSACGGGDVPYADALDAQAAAEVNEQVRPADYRPDTVALASADTNTPGNTDAAAAATDAAGTAATAPEAANPAAVTADSSNAAGATAEVANATAPAAEVANPAAPAAELTSAAGTEVPGAQSTPADVTNPAAPNGTNNSPTKPAAIAQPGQNPAPAPAGTPG